MSKGMPLDTSGPQSWGPLHLNSKFRTIYLHPGHPGVPFREQDLLALKRGQGRAQYAPVGSVRAADSPSSILSALSVISLNPW
jgi:hypothetical protein